MPRIPCLKCEYCKGVGKDGAPVCSNASKPFECRDAGRGCYWGRRAKLPQRAEPGGQGRLF